MKERTMDFIERVLGFAPDGGDGSFEFLLFAVPIAGIAYLVWRRRLLWKSGHADAGRALATVVARECDPGERQATLNRRLASEDSSIREP
jgi:hypothetical protein